ncbi:hypothetical protein ACA910_009021 [Epithemia clementina (nom. ined.)]
MPLPPPYNINADELRVALSYFTREFDASTFIQPSKRNSNNKPVIVKAPTETSLPQQPLEQPPKASTTGISKPASAATTKRQAMTKDPNEVNAQAKKAKLTAAADPSATAAATPPKEPPAIRNLKQNDGASIKVVWASQAFDVALSINSSKDTDSGDDDRPTLTLSGEEISGGGNAMALALFFFSSTNRSVNSKTTKTRLTDLLLQDEWCEWERTVLRPAMQSGDGNSRNKKNKSNDNKAGSSNQSLDTALEHLNANLHGVHIVPGTFTVADIALVSTLNLCNAKDSFPVAVQRYTRAHSASWTKAQTLLAELCQKQPAKVGALPTIPLKFDLDLTMTSLERLVDSLFRQVIEQLFGAIQLPATIVTKCSNTKHGDYQCSAAMPAFAALKGQGKLPSATIKSPQQLAAAMIDAIGPDNPVVMELSVNGPGFVMCRIHPSLLQYHVNMMVKTKKMPLPPGIAPQVCVVDFSSPNIAKEMHVGHLRSTIIGESVCRILEFVGHKVHRVNHVGDWGTQFGMLIQYLKEEYPNVSSGTELPNITDLTQFYKNAKQRFDESPEFKKQSQLNVVQLQSGDPDCLRIWKLLCDVSRQEFKKVYERLDVTLDECGESFYNDKIPAVIEEFQKAGLLTEEEGGAKLVFINNSKVPLMLQKTDGGYGYDSTDVAALKYRLQELKADRIIVITDFSQADHMHMVYAAGEAIGWVDRGQRLQHIGFGTVQGEDGKRFKTRSGDTVRLVDLLDEAAARLEESLQKRIQDGAAHISKEEAHEVAEAIGYGSVKYFDLRRNPTSNYKFSYDMMLDTKGDTGVYLLYARVRLESILAKAEAEYKVDLNNLGEVQIVHPSERNLAMALQQFPDMITMTLDDLFPYHICHFVYELSIAASDFVTQCRVLGSPEMPSRLLLCQATVQAMKQAFDLLGIRHVKRI